MLTKWGNLNRLVQDGWRDATLWVDEDDGKGNWSRKAYSLIVRPSDRPCYGSTLDPELEEPYEAAEGFRYEMQTLLGQAPKYMKNFMIESQGGTVAVGNLEEPVTMTDVDVLSFELATEQPLWLGRGIHD